MDFSAAELSALEAGTIQIGVFFFLDTPTPLRFWMGVGKINPGSNRIDTVGHNYNGFGELKAIPELEALINGQASRVGFQLSGVSKTLMDLIAGNGAAVKRKRVYVGIALMDRAWQLIGEVHWIWHGIADFPSFNVAGGDSTESAITRTIELSVGSLMTGRRRRGLSYYSHQDQQTKYPGDRFCERTGKYSQLIQKEWPKF